MPANASQSLPVRKRASHTRSRNGCKTCRIRRVRCDQTRPACRRCVSTGRSCDGYAPREDAKSQAPAHKAIYRPPVLVSADPVEYRFFDFFREKTCWQLAGGISDEFWSKSVLQASFREPAIRHAVMAIGALHVDFYQRKSTPASFPLTVLDYAGHANYHYAKAIGLLNKHLNDNGWENLDVSLLCCILCIGFEWLRGFNTEARVHLEHGLRILQEWYQTRTTMRRVSLSSPAGHFIRKSLIPIYTRLALQARTSSVTPSPLPWDSALLPDISTMRINSLEDARDLLYSLFARIFLGPRAAYDKVELRQDPRDNILSGLSRWSDSYAKYLARSGEDKNPYTAVLDITHDSVAVLLSTYQSQDQMQFDDYLPAFQKMVDRAESFVNSYHQSFSLEMGIVPQLYFVATRCRDPVIRRRATSVLKKTGYREGSWDGYSCARALEAVVAIEEAGLKCNEAADVKAQTRLRHVDMATSASRDVIHVTYAYQDSEHWCEKRVLIK